MTTYPKRINKWLYGWKLYVKYAHGWEYEIFEATVKGYKENRRLYLQNCKYPQRWTKSRELNPNWQANFGEKQNG